MPALGGAQLVKNLPAIQETEETEVRSLGREDALEEETATHFSVLAWRIPQSLGGHSPQGSQAKHVYTTQLWWTWAMLRSSVIVFISATLRSIIFGSQVTDENLEVQ